MREIGILRALGFTASKIRNLFLLEGAVLAVAGAAAGMGAALGYGELILYGLRTWWVDAVGTRLLSLHVVGRRRWHRAPRQARSPACARSPGPCAGCRPRRREAWWRASERSAPVAGGCPLAIGAILIAAALLAAAWMGKLDQTAGFFGAGALLLIAALLLRIGLAAFARVRRHRRPGHARPALRRLPAGTQHPVHRADRVGDVRDRLARSLSTRSAVRRHGWISADGRIGAAADPRSVDARRAARR